MRAERTRQYRIFQGETAWVNEVRSMLKRLDSRGAAWLAPLLLEGIPEQPRHDWIYHVLGLAPLTCFLGCLLWAPLLLAGLALIIVNIAINEVQGPRMTRYFPAFAQIHNLMSICQKLMAMTEPQELHQIAFLRERKHVVNTVHTSLGLLAFDRNNLPELASALLGYLNLCFLFDIMAFLRAVPALRRHRADLVAILEAVGFLDANMAVASYLGGLATATTTPAFADGRILDVSGIYHPLLPVPVGNNLDLSGRSVLLTGSNMSGKTTFIKTIGINLILGQSLNFCLAEKAILPRATVKSSIQRSDCLETGQSTFFVEFQRLLDFVNTLGTDRIHLFLIDEIFRGTNAVERIATSSAVLRHLGKHHIVLVTTHDLELSRLLGDPFDLYHFSERNAAGAQTFDYRLRPGPGSARNAIDLMEAHGFPMPIIEEARRLAERG